MKAGGVIWVTGLSGAGKTTVARALCARLEAAGRKPVFLDGDVMRAIFGPDRGYGPEDRLALAMSYGRLCRELSGQGLLVVCATISMFDAVRGWNRENIPGYFEVYLKVPLDVLSARHPRGLYERARNGQVRDVIGVDLAFDEPKTPDVVVENDGRTSPEEIARFLFNRINQTQGA